MHDLLTVLLCLTVSVFVAGLGGSGGESNGKQEDFDSMEKEALVTKLKQVGFSLKLDLLDHTGMRTPTSCHRALTNLLRP